MTVFDFVTKYFDQPNVGNTPENLGQCVGLISVWMDTLGIAHEWGNAKDLLTDADPGAFEVISNAPANFPVAGDIVVWGSNWGGGFGHTGVIVCADANAFSSFEQNNPTGHAPQIITHSYDNSPQGTLGWLHPKGSIPLQADVQSQLNEKNKAYDELYATDQENLHTISQQKDVIANLNQIVNDRNANITTLNAEVQKKETEIQARDQELTILKPIATLVPGLQEQIATQKTLIAQGDEKIQGLRDAITKLTQSNAQLSNSSAWSISKKELVQIFIKRIVGAKQ